MGTVNLDTEGMGMDLNDLAFFGFLSASILSITEIVETMLETADSSDALNWGNP